MEKRIALTKAHNNTAAMQQYYLDHAVILETIAINGHLQYKGPISHPIKGNLYCYKVANDELYYLDLNAVVAYNDYFLRHGIEGCMLPDLVAGTPLLPVKAAKQLNGNYSLIIKENAVEEDEINSAYTICCRIDVGEVQFVLAYNTSGKAPAQYVTWERTPSNEQENTTPNYYWGHYSVDYTDGMDDFIERVSKKYIWQKENNIR